MTFCILHMLFGMTVSPVFAEGMQTESEVTTQDDLEEESKSEEKSDEEGELKSEETRNQKDDSETVKESTRADSVNEKSPDQSEEAGSETSQTCGKELTWRLSGSSLHIEGTGDMDNFSASGAPWYDQRESIKTVILHEGVFTVGSYAFNGCTQLEMVSLPEGLKHIGAYAFCDTAIVRLTIPESVETIDQSLSKCTTLKEITYGGTKSQWQRYQLFWSHGDVTLSLNSYGGAIYSCDDGQMIYTKNVDHKVYPASITKLLSAYVCYLKAAHLDAEVTVTSEDLQQAKASGAVCAGLKTSIKYSYRDLFKLALYDSAADAIIALARLCYGSQAKCVSAMNSQAGIFQMTSSHFQNIIGLTNASHYTTNRDIVTLMKAVYDDEGFRDLMKAQTYRASQGSFTTTSPGVGYQNCVAYKPGYTSAAKRTGALVFVIDHHTYVVSVTGASTKSGRKIDIVNCRNYAEEWLNRVKEKLIVSCRDGLYQEGLAQTSMTLYKGKTSALTFFGDTSSVSYSSSNKRIASVSSQGVMKGVKAGTATITAVYKGIKYKCQVTVKNCMLKVNSTKVKIRKGRTYQITATPEPNAAVTYKTSKKSVATVSRTGLVKGLRKGKATVTVKANGVTKKVSITVIN